jgi:hypothetical protein
MSNWLSSLEEDNKKLRCEAKALKNTLRLANTYRRLAQANSVVLNNFGEPGFCSLSNAYNQDSKRFSKTNRKDQPSPYFLYNKENSACANTSVPLKPRNTQPSPYINTEALKNTEKGPTRIIPAKKKPKKKLLSSKNQSKSAYGLINSSKPNKTTVNIEPDRNLIDSFESYYESEEENITKTGKCKLSYAKYKKNHEKGSRRHKKNQSTSTLNPLNAPEKLQNSKNCKKSILKLIKYKTSRSPMTTKRSINYLSNIFHIKNQNCEDCDKLLANGLPSTYCKKHKLKD